MIDKQTKYCELSVYLKSGVRIKGLFHIPVRTSSTVRPADAIRECQGGFLILSNAVVVENGDERHQEAIMTRIDAVSHIELPSAGWQARTDDANAPRRTESTLHHLSAPTQTYCGT